jgi:hypothetical protein
MKVYKKINLGDLNRRVFCLASGKREKVLGSAMSMIDAKQGKRPPNLLT